jgi:polyphenol oxidase
MSAFTTAGRDPIFYGHHGNLDRLWSVWLNLPGGNRVNYDDPDWLTSSFLFWDENRNLVSRSAGISQLYAD